MAESILDPPQATRRPRAAYWLGVVLTPIAFVAVMDAIDRPPALDAFEKATAAQVFSDAARPPDFQAAPRVSLPQYINPAERGVTSVWYQAEVSADAQPGGLWAVYLPWSYGNYAVFVNGEPIGQSAPMTRPYPFFRRPFFYEFPATLLHAGANTVQVHLAYERLTGLFPFYVGPSEQLLSTYQRSYLLQVSSQQATLAALAILTLLMVGLFWIRPADTGYAWFAAAIAAWAAHVWLQLQPSIFLPDTQVWAALPIVMLQWFTIFSAFFINRLPGCGGPRRRWETGLLVFGVLSSAWLMTQPYDAWVFTYVYTPSILVIGASILWRLIDAVRHRPTFEVKLWLLGATACVMVGLRDHLFDMEVVTGGTQHYLGYTVSLLLIVVALTLLSRVTRALTQTETLNRELEARVAAKGAELERNYADMRVLERERLLSAERERMTRDMHDGIGGQLMHALSVVESKPEYQPLEPLLRGSLDDLRLIIDAVDPSGGDLLAILSSFRARNERRVREAGVRLVWEVSDLPLVPDFGPNKALQLLRILQEATTNVLRHAHATELVIRTGTTQGEQGGTHIVVEVVDNGRGYADSGKAGRGLGNMRRRAQMLDSTLELTTGPTGSCVRLLLPTHA
ncbi:MAG TPA: ATP-binding protein [Steroidobacteraceae bacterium]|nr:ATP-binding protein [Steroidobacteraceae bacterium]